jgi:prevent-host-death family protein
MPTSARTIGIRELKARTSEIFREMQATGAEFIITNRGRPVARIEPLALADAPEVTDGMGGLRGALTDWPDLTWEDFVEAKRLWDPKPLDD